jgi:hypothetical protein
LIKKTKHNKFYLEIYSPEHRWVYLGRIVEYNGYNVFMTHIKTPSKHYYYKGKSYPVNEELLLFLRRIGIHIVAIPEETGYDVVRIYFSKVRDYFKNGFILEPKTERQRYMPLEDMGVVEMDKGLFEMKYLGKY